MKLLISVTVWQFLLLLFLIAKDKNDGEKELFKQQQWKIFDVVVVVLLMNILVYILSTAEYILALTYPIEPFIRKLHLLFFPLLLVCMLIVLFKFRFNRKIKILGFKKNKIKNIITKSVITAFIVYLSFFILFLLTGRIFSNDKINSLQNHFDFVIYILAVIILGPIVEEVIFRGIFYSPYRKKYGPVLAIIITSLFFSISHYSNGGFLNVFVPSIFFGMLYEKTESIVAPIVAHSVYNLLVGLTAFYLLR